MAYYGSHAVSRPVMSTLNKNKQYFRLKNLKL